MKLIKITENKELVKLGKEASKNSAFVIYPPKEKEMSTVEEIDKDFVPYKESLDLKELGFDKPCFGLYSIMEHDDIEIGDFYFGPSYATKATEGRSILAPTFSQAFRWFRDKYNLDGFVKGKNYNHKKYYIYTINGKWHPSQTALNTYEKAELACLRKLIEFTKKNHESSIR